MLRWLVGWLPLRDTELLAAATGRLKSALFGLKLCDWNDFPHAGINQILHDALAFIGLPKLFRSELIWFRPFRIHLCKQANLL